MARERNRVGGRRFRLTTETERSTMARVSVGRGAVGFRVREMGSYSDAISLTVSPDGTWRIEARDASGTWQEVGEGVIPNLA